MAKYDRSLIEGPLRPAVWKLAWPTIITSMFGGLQGIVDHVMVGHFVGFTGNAAIGVSWNIFVLVIVFISSLFTGMSVLVARFTGAGDHDKVNRTVYQAFLVAIGISLGIMAPLGYVLSPYLIAFITQSAEVRAEALPFLRIMFVFSSGMMIFFMLGGALRAAGDARTPMVLGVTTTVLNIVLNVILIRGLGPIPRFGTAGAAMGTAIAFGLVALYSLYRLLRGGWVVQFPRHHGFAPDWEIIRALFRFGLPTGFQGIAMNFGGVFLQRFVGFVPNGAQAQAAYAVSYSELFSLVTWTSQGLLGATAAIAGQNLGAKQPERAREAVHTAARIGLAGAGALGLAYFFIPRQLLAVFGFNDPIVVGYGVHLLRVLSISGLFVTVALTYTGGLQGTGDTKSPFFISVISQVIIPLGICVSLWLMGLLQANYIWYAILAGHVTRCALSMLRFRQGKWREITVDIARDTQPA